MSKAAPVTRDQFKVWRTFTTRWSDNDAYGHVNNTIYYQWFDSAVNAWLVEQDMLDIAHGDPIALVVETRCTYAAPLAFPGEVEVGLSIAELGRSSMRYRIGIFAPGAASAAAHGEFVHVAVDRASRTPVSLPDAWRQKLEAILA
ncbi:acyl-CoA thioesterase [Sphingomonas lutea]|uniref:Acyl-CoA thioesterase n=1 Tax=Sphingomonas lutea TaxID=1045317 RepID=A0A7G9SEX5_9SPHN|nr:thioesterase family protein [Sphingomonas lutea]QNN66400.1 acyl-CoA thioesterase [Sphingomonas lutea]